MNHKEIPGVTEITNHLKSCNKEKPVFPYDTQSTIYPIMGDIYKRIRLSSERVKMNEFELPLIKEIDTYHKLTNFAEIDDSFIGKEIKDYVKHNSAYEIIYEHTLAHGQKITIFFIIPEFIKSTELINKYIIIILTWFEFIFPYSQKKCANKLDVYIYLTPFKKQLPQKGEIIGRAHVNTAYTTSCVPKGSIVIYRNEEWFKVLIHETFHVLGLDFSHYSNTEIVNEVKKIFPINSNINLYEAYTETWAEILNCVFVSYYRTKTKKDFFSQLKRCLATERDFALFQMLKVLNYMNLDYKDLYSDDSKSEAKRLHFYNEESNVFSYYIVTAILLFNVDKFILWCNDNNKNLMKYAYSPTTNKSFIELIRNNYKSKTLLNFLECLNRIKISSNRQFDELRQTMRMTIIDLIEN